MKKITFKKFIIIYSIVLAVLMAGCLIYVANSLVKYEDNQLDNFMGNIMEELKDPNAKLEIKGLSEVKKSAFDKADASARNGIAYLASNDSITYQQSQDSNDADNPVFDIMDGENPILKVKLTSKGSTTRLGLLTFNVWEVKEIELAKKEGLFNYEISAPVSCNVEVNGKKLTEKDYVDSVEYVGLAELATKTELAYKVKYLVRGLTDVPEIKITGKDGKQKKATGKGTQITVDTDCKKVADINSAKASLKDCPDILDLARTWSLYMSNDLVGADHGFHTIAQHLVPGTYLHKFAHNWATGSDIRFTSPHGFADPKFSNEKICNFIIYSDKEFSCDVYLQKNMRIGGRPLPDKMSQRMHFVYYDSTDDNANNPSWKIVSMQSITANR